MLFRLAAGTLLIASVAIGQLQAATNQSVAATLNGETISYQEVNAGSEQEIYEAKQKLYQLQNAGLKRVLIPRFIRLDPRSKGLTEDQYLSQFVISTPKVTDKDVDQFIVARQIPANKVNANLKEQAKRYIMQQQISTQIDDWMIAQTAKHQVKINLEPPAVPRFDVDIKGAPSRGPNDAPITIVEFSDFECPYCYKVESTLKQLDEIYQGKIKLVYKHYPLSSIHPNAAKAGEASFCAQDQGIDKFWQMHEKLFVNHRNLSVGRMKDFAKEIKLDYAAFDECLSSDKYAARVARDQQQGDQLGVDSTPAFLINGRLLKGSLPIEQFRAIIDEELLNQAK